MLHLSAVEYGKELATTTAKAMALVVMAQEATVQDKEELVEDSGPPKLQGQDMEVTVLEDTDIMAAQAAAEAPLVPPEVRVTARA